MTQRHGFTLVEVLIAIVVLTVGVLAAFMLQSSALRANSKARIIQEVTKRAAAELELRRQGGSTTGSGQACWTQAGDGYTCTVDVQNCALTSGTFDCSLPGTSDAQLITVTIVGPRSESVTVPELVATR